MTDKPLLLFPSRAKISYEKKPGRSGRDFKIPGRIKQLGRTTNMFKKINEEFEKNKAILSMSPDNLPIEMVLVFEIRGTIKDFFTALTEIPDLKWLGEHEKEFDSTDEFTYDDKTKPLPGKLFFFLANNSAIKQLVSLWRTWQSKKQIFERGTAKWKQLFDLLVDIRPWGLQDRIQETGILDDLEKRIQRNEETIRFEIELWYRKSKNQRRLNYDRVINLINKNGGRVIIDCDIEEISYQAILVESKISIFNSLINQETISFFKSNEVMYIRPVGQSISKIDTDFEGEISGEQDKEIQISFQPLIALLDGMPVQNHKYLRDRIDLFDPDNFQEDYPVGKRAHATGMASLIIYGDLNDQNTPLKSKILVRPVMTFHPFGENDGDECIPDNVLLVDLIHRSVKEIVEGNPPNTQPIAPSIKIINISLGDRYRIFDNKMSPWARLIDWLSEKYNILFIVSAGNVDENVEFNLGQLSSDDFFSNQNETQNGALKYFLSNARFRKIISPAESINALSIGACHEDIDSEIQYESINLYTNPSLMSPISRNGLGYRNSIKPDLLAKGGRIVFRRYSDNVLEYIKREISLPGIKVACPGDGGHRIRYSKGTSNAAALTSNTVGKLYESFIDDDLLKENLTNEYFAVVAKALLVHSTTMDNEVRELIQNTIPDYNGNKKDLLTKFLGYGKLNPERILGCTSKRVTLIGCQTIKPETAFTYELPLPDELSGTVRWRKLITTLAWITPINPSNQLYRTHKVWFEFPNRDYEAKLKAKRQFFDDDTVRRGTVQHEVFYSQSAQAFPQDSVLKIKVNCKPDSYKHDPISYSDSKPIKSIRYALVVTLEIDPEIELDVYDKISQRIKQLVKT